MADEAVRVSTDPRISSRRAAIAQARRRRWIATAILITVVGVGTWATLFSPLLHVREIRVTGAKHTDKRDVALAADLKTDDNLLLVSTAAIAERVRELPWVADAFVARKLPGTIRIRVVERTPAMVLATTEGKWTIDRDGRVLESGVVSKKLPVVAGLDIPPVEPGIELEVPSVQSVLVAYRRLPHKLRDKVEGVFAPTEERLSFSLTDGTLIRYGAAERLRAKNEVLLALLSRLRGEGNKVAYLDVRVPTSPAIGPRV
jgi:cell division protein FtsQ